MDYETWQHTIKTFLYDAQPFLVFLIALYLFRFGAMFDRALKGWFDEAHDQLVDVESDLKTRLNDIERKLEQIKENMRVNVAEYELEGN